MMQNPMKEIPHFLKMYYTWNATMPRKPMLVDDHYYEGWTRRDVEILSGKIYCYLRS